MPVIHAAQTVVHRMHGTSFTSYATPARGSKELCAWRIEIPGRTEGVPHRASREEVLFILSGTIRATVDDRCEQAAAGDVVLVPAGSRFGVDNLTDEPVTAGSRPASVSRASCRTAPGSLPLGPADPRSYDSRCPAAACTTMTLGLCAMTSCSSGRSAFAWWRRRELPGPPGRVRAFQHYLAGLMRPVLGGSPALGPAQEGSPQGAAWHFQRIVMSARLLPVKPSA